jgi:hypothetical protein
MVSKKCPAMLTQHFGKLSEFLLAMSSVESTAKFNLLETIAKVFRKRDCFASLAMTNGVYAVIARSAATKQSQEILLLLICIICIGYGAWYWYSLN